MAVRKHPCGSTLVVQPTLNQLKCQRTTDTVLHSALENRHSQFTSTLPPSCSFMEQNAAILISVLGRISSRPSTTKSRSSGINDLSRAAARGSAIDLFPVPAINHQQSTKNQFSFSFPCAQPRTKAPSTSTSLCMVCMI
jgi:hypothetical protein